MSKVKRQHYVPQSYLERWSRKDKSNQVFVFDKEQKRSFSSSIKGVASSNYFYDFPSELQAHKEEIFKKAEEENLPLDVIELLLNEQAIEKSLSDIEGIVGVILTKAIKKLDDVSAFPEVYINRYKIFSSEDRDILAYYIALQYARTEEIRMSMEEMSQKFYKEWSWLIMQNLDKVKKDKGAVTKVGKEKISDLQDAIDNKTWTKDSYNIELDPVYTKVQHLSMIFELAQQISKYLYSYKWLISRNFTTQPFFTSDNPVVKKANMNHPFYSGGFQSKGMEVHFPLSNCYTLTMHEPSYLQEKNPELMQMYILDATEQNVMYFNDIQVKHATNQLFCSENKFEMALKRIKESPEIAKKSRERITMSGFGEH